MPRVRQRIADCYTYTIPVMMGYIPLGLVFGFIFTQQGAEWWIAPIMSLLLFAGAAQFLAVGMIASDASIIEIAFACFIVNLRHIFYGISVRDIIPYHPLKRIYCIYALTDENFALLTGLPKSITIKYATTICAINHSYWVISALIGSIAGGIVSYDIPGLEFSLAALFTVLAIEQFKRMPQVTFVVFALLAYGLAILVFPDQTLFGSMCLAIALCLPIALKYGVYQKPENSHEEKTG